MEYRLLTSCSLRSKRRSENDIVVATKKLDALREWLRSCDSPGTPRVLLLVGPPGSGKSTALRLVAAGANFLVHEWKAPVPKLWKDVLHTSTLDKKYSSKIDDFSSFVSRVAKYSPLELKNPSDLSIESHATRPEKRQGYCSSRAVLLVEDFPVGVDDDHQLHSLQVLLQLSRECRFPTAISITRSVDGRASKANVSLSHTCNTRDVLSSRALVSLVESVGAMCLNFNPATTQKLIKALTKVARAEAAEVGPLELAALASAAHGDVRCAITNLQLLVLSKKSGLQTVRHPSGRKCREKKKELNSFPTDGIVTSDYSFLGIASSATDTCRDVGLTAFHALGKILYNKRDTLGARTSPVGNEKQPVFAAQWYELRYAGSSKSSRPSSPSNKSEEEGIDFGISKIHPSLFRTPLFNDPESILARAQLAAETATTFLFENFPDFLPDLAIDDMSCGSGYLSDAAFFLKSSAEVIGGSLAVRGLLFAPTPADTNARRWHQLRGPQNGKFARAIVSNVKKIRAFVAISANGFCLEKVAAAAELLPMMRVIAFCDKSRAPKVPFLHRHWLRKEEDLLMTTLPMCQTLSKHCSSPNFPEERYTCPLSYGTDASGFPITPFSKDVMSLSACIEKPSSDPINGLDDIEAC